MVAQATYLVVDIGKTLSKVTAWSREGDIIDRQVRRNEARLVDNVLRLDAEGIGHWLLETLPRYRMHPIEWIIPVAHGAGFAALDSDGLLFPPLDYEQSLPPEMLDRYRAERDGFAITYSPALPDGLNLGAQLWWAETLHPDEMEGGTLVPWAQYWAWFLCGNAASEVTSLACHTDLWSPSEESFSPMARRLGWANRFAPIMEASRPLGCIRSEIARRTGLDSGAQVIVGIHDSNAALLAARGFPAIDGKEATILSTGTWFVAMRMADRSLSLASLLERSDTLVNVDAYGRPVPSARFMGGREIESIIEIDTRRVDIRPDQTKLVHAVPDLLSRGTMMLPTLAPGFGPFPNCKPGWRDAPAQWAGTWFSRRAAVCLYAALVTDTSLDLIGSKDRILVEGRFAEAEVFVRALAALRPASKVFIANAHNDVSFGALRLIDPSLQAKGGLRRVKPLEGDLSAYKAKWHSAIAQVNA
jgi:sugar (pentulose or hexulose) kinase